MTAAGPWSTWDHITKIDPDKELVAGETYGDVCATGTDAIIAGGTTGMTEAKMERVLAACGEYDIPLFIEPSNLNAVVHHPSLDGYLVPTVFNAGDVVWTTGAHKEWARIDDHIDWDRTWTEAYIVLNPESAVAEYTGANCDLAADDVAAYAEVAERLFGQQIIYIEYSGMLGDPSVVATAAAALQSSSLFYGGGIGDYESARTMAEHADTIVVGNLVHEAGADAVRETVQGAHDG